MKKMTLALFQLSMVSLVYASSEGEKMPLLPQKNNLVFVQKAAVQDQNDDHVVIAVPSNFISNADQKNDRKSNILGCMVVLGIGSIPAVWVLAMNNWSLNAEN